jgi:hypothetical protein
MFVPWQLSHSGFHVRNMDRTTFEPGLPKWNPRVYKCSQTLSRWW